MHATTTAGPVLPDSDSAEVMELSATTTASRHHGHRGDVSPNAAKLQGSTPVATGSDDQLLAPCVFYSVF